ncbi:hypothetical protein FRC09_011770 [Ceratobasidium sp. 395]|nr:hypothetical protein FRC09_011770 [Ceratobasidium sp. 395]
MSSAGSLGEADAKFPTAAGHGIGPEPTPENPGGVYPKSDPQPEKTNQSGAGFNDKDAKAHATALREGMDAETKAGDALTTREGGLYTD